MIIDSHVHMYKRDMIPHSVVDAYLEPLRALDELGIDMGLDEEVVWKEFVADRSGLIEMMDMAGIDKAIILPLDMGMVEEPVIGVEEYNHWVFEAAQGFEDMMIPFMGVDPSRGEFAIDLVNKFHGEWEPKGVKIYPSTGFYPDDEELLDFWRLIDDLGMLVITHIGASWGPLDEKFSHPKYYRKVLEEFPSLNVVLAHLGGKWREEAYELLEKFDNAYTDCSALQGWLPSRPDMVLDRLEEMASKIPNKAFFGTDWPTFDLAYSSVRWTDFVLEKEWASQRIKEKIMFKNIKKVLSI